MRCGIGHGGDIAPGMTRGVVRLFGLLGMAVVAYLALCLFDHAARADAGWIDQPVNQIGAPDPVAQVKAVPHRKPISPKLTATGGSHATHRPTIKRHEVDPPKAHAPKKIHDPRIRSPRKSPAPNARAGETVR